MSVVADLGFDIEDAMKTLTRVQMKRAAMEMANAWADRSSWENDVWEKVARRAGVPVSEVDSNSPRWQWANECIEGINTSVMVEISILYSEAHR